MADKDCLISKESLHEIFIYDSGVLRFKKTKLPVGHIDRKGYIRTKIKGVAYLVHRIVFMMHHGYMPKQVDHIDGNRQNNLIENLREASSFENSWNRKNRLSNSSGVKGVDFFKPKQKWRARCMVKGKSIHVGYFYTLESASEAIKLARAQAHGCFARD